MAWTSDDLALLDEAIATGALEVEANGRRMRYRSLADMLRTRDMIANELTARKPSRLGYVNFARDW